VNSRRDAAQQDQRYQQDKLFVCSHFLIGSPDGG